jgi:hypothetical protein
MGRIFPRHTTQNTPDLYYVSRIITENWLVALALEMESAHLNNAVSPGR